MAINLSYFDPTYSGGFRADLAKFDPTRTPKYQGVNPYNLNQSAQDIQSMYQQLGINPFQLGPATDTRDAQRTAVMGQLDQQGQRARSMSDQAYLNRGTGAFRSGAARRGIDNINVGLAQAKAGAEAGIQQDFANRQAEIDRANAILMQQHNAGLLSNTMQNANNRTSLAVGQADRMFQANQMNPFQARQELAGGVMSAGGKILSLIPGGFF